MDREVVALSKTVSHALRHAPWLYELEPDGEGWVPVRDLLEDLKQRRRWRDLTEDRLAAIAESGDKRRFELRDSKIRALYGHSLPGRLSREPAEPPEVLYHGTSPGATSAILGKGLKPMKRQYVHLSADIPTALEVGRRKAEKPVILVVDAERAHQDGIRFYRGNDRVWLADEIPAAYIWRISRSANL
jgi:putative RNA 2'-phosphotransferase